MLPRAIFFDLDGTLADSKQPLTPLMAATLPELLCCTKVAVTSGGKLEQLVKQVADRLPPGSQLDNLYLLPTSGAALYEWKDGKWNQIYEIRLSDQELAHIEKAIIDGARKSRVIDLNSPSHGDRIELRGAQVTLSALGQEAPIDEKRAWDPTHEKRQALRAAIAPLLPDYDVKVGGATSVDVTKKGVNKAYGIQQFSQRYGIPIPEMLYVGDELSPGGNDEIALSTGIPARAVADPADTIRLIGKLLDSR